MAECAGHQGRAAEELGLHRSNLSRIIRDLDLSDEELKSLRGYSLQPA